MPQFDIIFFSNLGILLFIICLNFIFIFFINSFVSFYKIRKFTRNLHEQKLLILTIKKELEMREAARKS